MCVAVGNNNVTIEGRIIKVMHNKKDRLVCRNYRDASPVHAGEVLLMLVVTPPGNYGAKQGLHPEELSGFRRNRSTVAMMFVRGSTPSPRAYAEEANRALSLFDRSHKNLRLRRPECTAVIGARH